MASIEEESRIALGGESEEFEKLREELGEYGLTDNEAKVFIHLLKLGPMKASEIGLSLGISRTEVYNILTSLQNKGIIEASLDRPAKFSAIGFEKALEILIEAEKRRIMTMEKSKEELMEIWKKVRVPSKVEEQEKIQLLKGIEQIYARLSDMLDEAKEEVNIVASRTELVRAYNAGILQKLRNLSKDNIHIQILTHGILGTSSITSFLKKHAEVIEVKTMSISSPWFVIVDNKQLLMFTKPPGVSRAERKEATAIWTNSDALVQSLKKLFTSMMQPEEVSVRMLPAEQELKMKEEEYASFKEQLSQYLSMVGLQVKEGIRITGKSGITHVFDMGVLNGDKPIVCDIVFDVTDVPVTSIIGFYTKKNDVEDMINGSTLIVKPRLSEDAKQLATFYGIRVVELQPS
jgi:sugar-specific transcriptional regulator TrmB